MVQNQWRDDTERYCLSQYKGEISNRYWCLKVEETCPLCLEVLKYRKKMTTQQVVGYSYFEIEGFITVKSLPTPNVKIVSWYMDQVFWCKYQEWYRTGMLYVKEQVWRDILELRGAMPREKGVVKGQIVKLSPSHVENHTHFGNQIPPWCCFPISLPISLPPLCNWTPKFDVWASLPNSTRALALSYISSWEFCW